MVQKSHSIPNHRFGCTHWKINMEPTNQPFGKENDLPNLQGIMLKAVNLPGCIPKPVVNNWDFNYLSLLRCPTSAAAWLRFCSVTLRTPMHRDVQSKVGWEISIFCWICWRSPEFVWAGVMKINRCEHL